MDGPDLFTDGRQKSIVFSSFRWTESGTKAGQPMPAQKAMESKLKKNIEYIFLSNRYIVTTVGRMFCFSSYRILFDFLLIRGRFGLGPHFLAAGPQCLSNGWF